jgi:uncharacterized protein YwgA
VSLGTGEPIAMTRPKDLLLWVLSIAEEAGVRLTYTRLQKTLYCLKKDFEHKLGETIPFDFEDYLFGPYDRDLQQTLDDCNANGLITNIYRTWRNNLLVPTFDVTLSEKGSDYVKRIATPRLESQLGPVIRELHEKLVRDYLRRSESDLVGPSRDAWLREHPDQKRDLEEEKPGQK